MSITPVDKPPDGDEGSDGALSRRSSSLREHVGRFFSWLAERAANTKLLMDDPEDPQTGGPAVSARTNDPGPRTTEPSASGSFTGFPSRERPLTYPARDSPGVNTPDIVSIETDQGLRLSVPENPDATLTSDVWTKVEP